MAAQFAAHGHDVADATPSLPSLSHTGVAALLRRLETGMHDRLRARREARVTEFIEANGGKLTDELEREISRRFGSMVL